MEDKLGKKTKRKYNTGKWRKLTHVKEFNEFLNEGSHSDFMMRRGKEIQDAVKKLKEIGKLPEGKITDAIYDKIEDKLKVYDTNVPQAIDHWIAISDRGLEADMLVDLGFQNQNRWGTEPQMILQAIDDYYEVLARAGLVKDEDEDED